MSTVAEPGREVEILTGKDDRYDGVMVEIEKAVKVDAFVASLKASISKWKELGKKGVWLKIPLQFAQLVPAAVEEGFWYHHAEPTHLMLVYWLPGTLHTLPVNATHRVGIGAFVINSERQITVCCGLVRGACDMELNSARNTFSGASCPGENWQIPWFWHMEDSYWGD